ncbi:hypothetical protein [Microcystis sp. M_OC_Ca_00000000_S217Cul]|uniref:hypothetical protein n=1 Tax=Microcystis sp. M_OC_Ca_00000000_S217Cul TaxID=2486214 RepID=UPI00257DD449|nr:hypothetical protein [Microcystis sp. M_OC_Ca_00000000_S217Cul]
MSIVFYLERTNQLSLLPDKDLVDLCPPIELSSHAKLITCPIELKPLRGNDRHV